MQGNWSAGPDPVSAPAKGQQHQHQHQHQQILQHQQQRINLADDRGGSGGGIPHSPATPGWNIADRIVKEELPEDKNNDSGVSPGHYTSNSVSPRSRRSSSTANGSLSPGSATSQDSNAIMQYEYSPQRIFKSCVSPLGFSHSVISDSGNRSPKLQSSALNYAGATDTMMQIMPQGNNRGIIMQNGNEQNVDMVSSTMKPESDDSDNTAMQCPICTFTTIHRIQFNEHLASHCSPKCVDPGDFSSSNYTNLSSLSEDGARGSPSQGDRSEHEFEDLDEPGLRVPRVNCQGKVKTFRCKQCNFVAITKLEFWEHSRGHIKAEKLLTCPKCPFVTEYKHHLEYHLRNHFGSKPFKCDKCPYSCVNKSMLNSHLKSHSNVYQYRCAECSYATKYCHSLKLHLRKYSHKPAMVLNPDGSPNPLPIIDIYGTRRGPKQKATLKTTEDGLSVGQVCVPEAQSVIKMAGGQFLEHNMHPGQLNVPFPYSQILTAAAVNFPVNFLHHQLSQCDNNNEKNNNRESIKRGFELFGKIQEYTKGRSVLENQDVKRLSPTLGNGVLPGFEAMHSPVKMDYQDDDEKETTVASPLDLSKPDAAAHSCKTNSPRSVGTSRRKGRAFKLDKLVVAQDSEDESYPVDQDDDRTMKKIGSPVSKSPESAFNGFKNVHSKEITSDLVASVVGGAGGNSDYNCQYCDIAFGNVVMYTVHMGYHGYKDPYTCNMCGHQCNDKVSFFLHIARDSHS